jgi:hypothetical protein
LIDREFRLDEDEALLLYLDRIFATPESQHHLNGQSKLDMAETAIREITAKDVLMKKLVAMYSKVSVNDNSISRQFVHEHVNVCSM